MKRLALLLVAAPALLLSGCVVPSHTVVRAAPVTVAAHIHGPGCGHFWGYHSGYPVYFHANRYTYYDGGTWLELRTPPRVHHSSRYYHRPPARYTPPRSSHQRPAKVHRPSTRGNQSRPHRAAPAHR